MIDYIPLATLTILTIILFIFLINRQRKKAQKKRIAAEKQRMKELESILENFDWWYNSADNFRKWKAGNLAYYGLREYMKTLPDKKAVDDLYNKYCPWDKKDKDGVIVQQENKETDTSDKIDFDEFEGFVPFEEVIDNMKEILGTEIFEILGLVGYTNSESGYIASDKNNTTSDEETLLKAFFEKYKVLYACFSLVAKEEKMDISSVMDLIYPDLKKTPSWVSNASEVSKSTIHMLFYSFRTNDLNNKAFEDFEKKDYNKGLAKAAESLFLLFLHPSKMFAFKSDMAIYLDTVGWGLFLNQQFLHSATVHTKSIALDSDSDNIAMHLFNRGMALYLMVSPTEIGIDLDDKQLDFKQRNIDLAKADFQKALEKDPSFEQAQEMLESLNKGLKSQIESEDSIDETYEIWIAMEKTTYWVDDKEFDALEFRIEFSDGGDGEHEIYDMLKSELNCNQLIFMESKVNLELKLQRITELPEIDDRHLIGDGGHHGPFCNEDELLKYITKLKTISYQDFIKNV